MSNALVADAAAPVSARPRNRRRAALLLAGAAAIGAVAWYGYGWWTVGRFFESTDDAYVGGNVTAIAPHVGGFVERVLVADNQRVSAGTLLIQLDRRDYAAALDHAKATLAARLASAESLRARRALQDAAIRQAEAESDARVARAAYARQDADRYRALALTAAGSRQDEQRTLTVDAESRAAMLAAAAALEAAHQQVRVLDAQVAEAEAEADQARSDVATAQLNLGWTEVRAPIDGYVGNRAGQVGSYVAAGAYLMSVIPAEGLWADANFKEDQLAGMAPDQEASVVADVLPGHAFRGKLVSMAPGTGAVFSVIPPENATGNFTKIVQRVPVRIAFEPDPALGMLRPGLSVTVRVDTRK
jgi:membrane fusion protein (multidrug efflux system)